MSASVVTPLTPSARSERRRRVRRARNFFIIAVLAALVSVAGHCLPGDAPHTGAGVSTRQTSANP
jgi:hypothetical protein